MEGQKLKRKLAGKMARGNAEGNSMREKASRKVTPITKDTKNVKSPAGGVKKAQKKKSKKQQQSGEEEEEFDVDDVDDAPAPKRQRKSSDSEDNDLASDEIDVDEPIKSSKKKSTKKTQKKQEDSEDDDEEEPMDTEAPNDIISTAAKKLKQMSSGNKTEAPAGGLKKRKNEEVGKDENEPVKPEHMKRKERKVMRQSKDRSNYELSREAKSVWNELRRQNLPAERRKELSNQLYDMIKGKSSKLIYAHDTSRVIQCLMKYGLQTHKDAVFEELKDQIVELCKSQYAKFYVRRLLKYGNKAQRSHVFTSFHGKVRKLIKHKNACEVIEIAYNDYANSQQRSALVEEFYGSSYAYFKKTGAVRTIEDIVKETPDKKEVILKNMKEALLGLAEKSLLQYSIIHKVFLEYFTHASEKQRSDMIEALREGLIHMLHTKDGAKVAMLCLWHGTAKDRKLIVKSMKTYVVKVCKEEHGHMVLLAMLDAVDDTKLVSKAILDELLKNLMEVATDPFGRKVLMYLLMPRDTKYFHPDVVRQLTPGDGNLYSKKETAVRREELLEHVSKPLLKFAAENADKLLSDNVLGLLLIVIITKAKGDVTAAMRGIAELAALPFTSSENGAGKKEDELAPMHVVEGNPGNLVLKKLIQEDKQRMKDGQEVLFSSILLDVIPEGSLKSWAACNRGCFTLCQLLELEKPDVTEKVKKALQGITASLKKMEFKGAQILLSKLN